MYILIRKWDELKNRVNHVVTEKHVQNLTCEDYILMLIDLRTFSMIKYG